MTIHWRRVRRVCLRALLWLVIVLALAGCGGNDDTSGVAVDLTISPDPPKVGPAEIVVTLADAEGNPIAGASLELEGTMTHPGMKPVFADAKETAAGRYEATLQFTMGGDWIIIVRGELPDGSKLEREIEVRGVQVG